MKYTMNKLTLHFNDVSLEKEYRKFHIASTFKYTKLAMILGLVMFYFFGFIDSQIVDGLKNQNRCTTTVIEQTINNNVLLNNSLTNLVKTPFETIMRQNNQSVNELEASIWKIRFNTLLIGFFLFGLCYINFFKNKIEILAAFMGIVGSVSVSLMISYVSGTASYIYLSGLILIMTWLALLARLRFSIVLPAMLAIIIFNNIITSNKFIENVLCQGKDIVGGLVLNGSFTISLPVNNFFLLSTMILLLVSAYILEQYARDNFVKNKENEELLLNILPKSIAELKKHDDSVVVAQDYDEVTILFADIVGFTKFANHRSSQEVVYILNLLYTQFDNATIQCGVEKIKTLGDGYLVASGIPEKNSNHAQNAMMMAIQMQHIVKTFNQDHGVNFQLRIGIHSGSIVAGVVGKVKYAYDIWGDTVNIASRMESTGLADAIQVSAVTFDILKPFYDFESRGEMMIKGIGTMSTYLWKAEK